jgi:hypothetical protein
MKMVTERKQSTVASEKKAVAIANQTKDMIVQEFSLMKEDDITEIAKPLMDLVVLLEKEEKALVVTSANKSDASNLGARAQKAEKAVDAKRTEIKAPYLEAGKIIDNGFMPIVKSLKQIRTNIGDKLTVVLRQERIAAEAEANKRAEAARKQAAEEARKEGLSKAKAEHIGNEVAAVVYSNIANAAPTGMSTAAGSSKLKTKKTFEVVDFSKIPQLFLTVDHEKVMNAINSGIEIPGIKTIETESVQFRTR